MPSYTLLSLATLLAALPAAQATWEHYVTVGKHGNAFEPPYVHAHVGAKIKFQFFPKNHTATQATFDEPCKTQPWGIDSGFQPVGDIYTTSWFEFEVKDEQPSWFYCQQGNHCTNDGMVFAVNPPSHGDKTFEAFQALAKAGAKEQSQASSAAVTTEHAGSEPPSYGHWDANGQPATPPQNSNSNSGSTLSGSASTGNSFSSVSGALEGDAESSGSAFGKWAPIVIGLLAGNLLISLILVALNVMGYIRRGGRESGAKTRSAPSYAPVRVMERGNFPSEGSYSDNEAGKRYAD